VKKHNFNRLVIAMGIAIVGSTASAQTSPIRPQYQFPTVTPSINGAAGVEVADGNYFFPYFNFAIGHDDNIYESSTNATSSNIYISTPGFKLQSNQGSVVWQLGYEAPIGRFTGAQNNNYVDQNALATVDIALSSRSYLRVGADYIRGHDPIGSTDTPSGTYPNKYKLGGGGALFAYGAPGAEGRFEIAYAMAQKRYLNNPQYTDSLSRDTDTYGAAFYWRVMPKTYLIAEARFNDYNYLQPTTPGDNNVRRYFVGVTWEATAKTTGTIKLGTFQQRFDNTVPDNNETSWEAQITWTPLTYSKFDLFSSKQPTQATGLGDAINVTATGLAWRHDWNSKLSTGLSYIYSNDDYVGFDRTDKVNTIGFKVGYQMRRWLDLGFEYIYVDRDSNLNQYDYTRNRYFFTLGLTL